MSKRFVYEDDCTIITFTDNVSAFSGLKKATFPDKGRLSNLISAHIFEYLSEQAIPTQYIERVSDESQRVLVVDMIPLEVIIRNRSAGTWMESLGFKDGETLDSPIIEYRYKNHRLKDPMINSTHIYAMKMCTEAELHVIQELSHKINSLLTDYFKGKLMDLIDLKLEFGKNTSNEIILADSITPDTMRIWDTATQNPMDKDVFRKDLDKLNNTYAEVLRRLEEVQ